MQVDLESLPVYTPQICQRFQALVWSCLDSGLSKSGVFYAERFFALDNANHDARHLYVQALLAESQPYSALSLVNIPRDQQCSGCLELKARCCSTLGRHRQARDALDEMVQDSSYITQASGKRVARLFPEEAALFCRAGVAALKGNLPEDAVTNFRQALTLNPMIWEAFEGLCNLGHAPSVDEILPARAPPSKRNFVDEPPTALKSGPTSAGIGFFTPEPVYQSFNPDLVQPHPFRMAGPRDSVTTNDSSFQHESSFQFSQRPSRLQGSNQPHTHFSRPLSSADETGPDRKKFRSESTRTTVLDDTSRKMGQKNLTNSTRRSNRLLSGTGKQMSTKPTRDRRRQPTQTRSISAESDREDEPFEAPNSPSPPSAAFRSEGSPSPSNWTYSHDQATQESFETEQADYYIYDLVRRFALAARYLAIYECLRCIEELTDLPARHQRSPLVLAMIGRAHYERLDYTQAERAFKGVRAIDSYRLWDMEVYSTLLWHQQESVELSYLAQELINISPSSPQTWIAVGNLFSLQRERSQALTCFRRAYQLDPGCAYAYTLSGHECIDEDVNRAITFFQHALRADSRHYNAWYGLGTCYLRMSKVRLAEYHYRRAVEIHPNNAVLLGCVGMSVERRGDRAGALELFDKAVEIAPENALVRYRRSKILISFKRYREAITDLEQLRNTTPEESNVVFQLAKAYRLIGDEVKSVQALAVARDITPKNLTKIKKLLEIVKDESVEDRMEE